MEDFAHSTRRQQRSTPPSLLVTNNNVSVRSNALPHRNCYCQSGPLSSLFVCHPCQKNGNPPPLFDGSSTIEIGANPLHIHHNVASTQATRAARLHQHQQQRYCVPATVSSAAFFRWCYWQQQLPRSSPAASATIHCKHSPTTATVLRWLQAAHSADRDPLGAIRFPTPCGAVRHAHLALHISAAGERGPFAGMGGLR
jgi:hypothetical protein